MHTPIHNKYDAELFNTQVIFNPKCYNHNRLIYRFLFSFYHRGRMKMFNGFGPDVSYLPYGIGKWNGFVGVVIKISEPFYHCNKTKGEKAKKQNEPNRRQSTRCSRIFTPKTHLAPVTDYICISNLETLGTAESNIYLDLSYPWFMGWFTHFIALHDPISQFNVLHLTHFALYSANAFALRINTKPVARTPITSASAWNVQRLHIFSLKYNYVAACSLYDCFN